MQSAFLFKKEIKNLFCLQPSTNLQVKQDNGSNQTTHIYYFTHIKCVCIILVN